MIILYLDTINNEDDKRSFEHIYISYRLDMFKIARSILLNEADAEDIVHDVFYKIATKHMSKIHRISSDIDLRNYLLKITKNAALSHIAKKHNIQSLELMAEQNPTPIPELIDDSFLDTICLRAEYSQIKKAIESMDTKYRTVLYEHFICGLSISEVASHLNLHTETVRKQLYRGKKLLLSKLNPNYSPYTGDSG